MPTKQERSIVKERAILDCIVIGGMYGTYETNRSEIMERTYLNRNEFYYYIRKLIASNIIQVDYAKPRYNATYSLTLDGIHYYIQLLNTDESNNYKYVSIPWEQYLEVDKNIRELHNHELTWIAKNANQIDCR